MELRSALRNAGVTRRGESLVCVQTKVSYAGDVCANFWSLISRAIVDYDHLEIGSGVLRALDRARQQPRTVVSGDDDADAWHDDWAKRVCILATKMHKKQWKVS